MDAASRVAFDAYNARPITPTRVAETFIPPDSFKLLSRRAHSLLVGPRGSGKTTLMKMLTPEGLSAWNHPEAAAFRARIDYTGVFIPTDITWTKQMRALSGAQMRAEDQSRFVKASFIHQVLRSFAGALSYCLVESEAGAGYLQVSTSRSDQALLVRELADAWGLNVRIESPLGLKAALASVLSQIAVEANREREIGEEGRPERLSAIRALNVDLVPTLTEGLDRIEAVLPELAGQRWALLFDELELAPSEIKRDLLSSMRSVDERLLFKLSISPYNTELDELRQAISAMPGHDHDEISLSYGRKEEGHEFSFALMRELLRQVPQFSTDEDPLIRLGNSDFDAIPSERTGRYARGSRVSKAFGRLRQNDATFRQYVDRYKVSVDDLASTESNSRAENVRKVMPLVLVRDAFRNPDDVFEATGRRLKGRKAADVYRGAGAMATMFEGNPRWIIHSMTSILAALPAEATRVPVPLQTAEVGRTANRFRALLTALPSDFALGRRRRGLLPLIDTIGEYFRARVLVDPFTADPVGTFVVDATATDAQIDALGSAINAGVVIYVPDDHGAAILNSVRGKRFRLTYLFAPTYQLPLRLERSVALSAILEARAPDSQGSFDFGDLLEE